MNNIKGLLAIFIVLLLAGCTTIKKDWEKAQSLNTTNAYQEFLRTYPKSTFTVEAKIKIENIDWQKAKQINTIEAYKNYLDVYPNGSHRITATQNIEELTKKKEELAGSKVKRVNSFEAYNKFILRYPESIHKSQAKKWIDTAFASASPITDDKFNMIKRELADRIVPFKLSHLYDKSMVTSQSLGEGSQSFGMQDTFEDGVKTMIYRTESGSVIKKTKSKQEGEAEVKVTLQAIPEIGIVAVFHKKTGMIKSEYQLRITNPKYNLSNDIMFTELEIDNFTGLGKRINIICRDGKCYDYDSLNPDE